MFHRRPSSRVNAAQSLSLRSAAVVIASSLLASAPAFASQTSTWTGGTSTDWSTASNWSPSNTAPNNGDAGISDFDVVINTAANQPTINAPVAIDNLTLNTGVTLTIAPSILFNVNGPAVNNNGTILVDTFTGNADLNFTANTTLSGTGNVFINDYGPNAILSTSPGATLTNNQTIGGIGEIDASLVNNGIINANISSGSKTLYLQSQNMTNNGLMQATNSGILAINAITISQTANGTISNIGGVVNLSGATIAGGNLSGNITVLSDSSVADVTIATGSKITINAGIVLNSTGSTITNNGTIQVDTQTADAALNIAANTTLTGTGNVFLNDYGPNARIIGAANATLTNDTAHTIHGVGEIDVPLINNGTVSGDFSGHALVINGATTNNGLIQATAKGIVQFASGSVVSNGTLSGGTFRVDSNSTMTFSDPISTNAATILLSGSNATITGIDSLTTNSGNFTLQNGANFTLAGNLTNSGNISLSGAALKVGGNFTQTTGSITGNGTLTAGALFGNISVTTGLVQVAANGTDAGTSNLSSLTIAGTTDNWTGNINIRNNKLIVEALTDKSATLQTLTNQVHFGLTHNAGITTSALPTGYGVAVVDNAALSTPFTTFGGQPVDSNSILISAELRGDANLDGKVDLTDLSTVLNHFGESTSNWTDGNFDYAATIDLTDLSDILNNFGLVNTGANSVSLGGGAVAAPEPASLAALSAGALLLAKRRQRRAN
ncbi:MAG: beta strand repeat-containing protein [Phycisphaerae bacterium]